VHTHVRAKLGVAICVSCENGEGGVYETAGLCKVSSFENKGEMYDGDMLGMGK
jgi:hypothetical protein